MDTLLGRATRHPRQSFWHVWNLSFGFFGIQVGFALQSANASRIFQSLGASIDALPVLWIAGPVTGLIVQPVVGYFSDRTWTTLGRRRPFILAGATLASLSLVFMPSVPYLWMAAGALWILDVSLNTATEPFRAYVADSLPSSQRTLGYAMQGVFIGAGAVVASILPYVLTNYFDVTTATQPGAVPLSVRLAFYIGAAFVLVAVLWTVVTTKEYSPLALATFNRREDQTPSAAASRRHEQASDNAPAAASAATRTGAIWIAGAACLFLLTTALNLGWQTNIISALVGAAGAASLASGGLISIGKRNNFFTHIIIDISTMPRAMRRLAVVQFFSWAALFMMWIFATPVVTQQFGSLDANSAAFNAGADWVGVLFAAYNLVAALYSFALPAIARRVGVRQAHAVSLGAGAAGLVSFFYVTDPQTLLVSMIGVGMAWASILTLPYAMLADSIPYEKTGVYMGIFNFFIVLPQLFVSSSVASLLNTFFSGQAVFAFVIAAGCWLLAAAATYFVTATLSVKSPRERGEIVE